MSLNFFIGKMRITLYAFLCNLFAGVQSVNRVCLFVTPWIAAHTVSPSLLEFMSIESVMLSNHLILYHPLSPFCLPSFPPVLSNELTLRIRGPEDWSFSFSISPPSEYSELISFRIRGSVLQSKGLSRIFSSTTIQKRQFFGAYFPEYSSTFRQ